MSEAAVSERRRTSLAALVGALGLLAFAPPLGAQSAEAPGAPSASARAEELYLGADFDAARAAAEASLASPTATREELVRSLRVLVALDSMTGTPDTLARSARSLALLDPAAAPADGAPESALEAVQTARSTPAPTVELTREGDVVSATAAGTPSVASELALRCEDAAGTHGSTAPATGEVTLEVSGEGEVHCTAELRTAGGIVLASGTIGARPSGGSSAGSSDELPWILVGVGGGLVVVGVVIGIVVAASSSGPRFDAPVVIGW